MIINRTGNTIRNIFWGIVNKIVSLFIPFVVRTVMIYYMGAEYLGLGSLFTSVLTVLNLAELGVSSAIICSMYKPIAEDDKETICALMNLYKKVYRIIGLVVFGLGMMVLPFLKYLIKGNAPADINIYILYLIYLLNTSVSYFLFAYKNCLFTAHQRTDIGMKTGSIFALLQNLIQIFVIVTIRNYYVYVIIIPMFTIMNNVVTAIWATKVYPEYKCMGEVPQKIKNALKKQIMGLMIGKISGTIRASIDSLFISILLGLVDVAKYNNYFYIVTAVTGFVQLLEGSMVAGVGNSLVAESVKKNYIDFKKFTFMLAWIVGFCSICILCMTQTFMRIWVGDELLYNNFMPVLCAAYFFVTNISMIRSIYTQAAGMWWELRILSLVDVFVNLFLNIILGYFLGAYGILFASFLDVLLVSIPWTTYFLFKGYFGEKYYMQYMGQLTKYATITILAGFCIWMICQQLPMNNLIINLITRGVVCLIVTNMVYWIIYHKSDLFKISRYFIDDRVIKKIR